MTASAEPIEAVATDGIVALFLDPTTARALANAWEFTYASGGLDDTVRPRYLLDCAAIQRAATAADVQAAREVSPVEYVPVISARDQLHLIQGEGA